MHSVTKWPNLRHLGDAENARLGFCETGICGTNALKNAGLGNTRLENASQGWKMPENKLRVLLM